ncbi:MAG: hypothetical protein ACO2Z9_09795 [Crocinitomicaceae bacterium]
MHLPHHDSTTTFGTITGTALSVFATIQSQDLLKTVVLAIVGASVSFFVSLFLKWVKKKFWG